MENPKANPQHGKLDPFSNYLSNRTQRVEVNGTLSESAALDMSVFQGTILGPTLFSCFINDLPNCTELLTVLYADDTTGLDSDSDLNSNGTS